MDRDGLADFLRRRRDALQPDDVGLRTGIRRRTRGLRREEVAGLAHMSTDFYARLEQRRGSRPSEQTTATLTRALRLTQDERDHLYGLAGHIPPPRTVRTDHASPGLLRVLTLLDCPAQIVSDLGVTLAQNPLAEALVGVQTPLVGPLTLGCQILTAEDLTERLVVFTATPGSEDAHRVALLSVIGSQQFPSGAALRAE